jgi:hypothetical protein
VRLLALCLLPALPRLPPLPRPPLPGLKDGAFPLKLPPLELAPGAALPPSDVSIGDSCATRLFKMPPLVFGENKSWYARFGEFAGDVRSGWG